MEEIQIPARTWVSDDHVPLQNPISHLVGLQFPMCSCTTYSINKYYIQVSIVKGPLNYLSAMKAFKVCATL